MYDMLSDIKTPTAEGRAVDELMRRMHHLLSTDTRPTTDGNASTQIANVRGIYNGLIRVFVFLYQRYYRAFVVLEVNELLAACWQRLLAFVMEYRILDDVFVRTVQNSHSALSGQAKKTSMMICDAFQTLTSACTSTAESPPSLKAGAAPTAAFSRELALFPASNATRIARNSRSGLTGYAQLDAFTRSVEKITTLRVPRLAAGERVGSMFSSMDAVLGLQLVASNRRDFRACVNFVLPGSDAEAFGIHPAALVVALNGQSMKGISLQRVMGAIRRTLVNNKEERGTVYAEVPEIGDYIEIDLAQREHEVHVDRNPHALTQFPSPQGQHLPGVKQFQDLFVHVFLAATSLSLVWSDLLWQLL
ncbi:hypothetical protein BBP00_00002006 [Phytophthora kernoviae]|uniref:PDZ domain-containing protein n=2 Tax=Phytophthora kernoviae TaxID=325452 RepID=A0A3F2S069_9STRA|nr:hypothetical protein BBP00_00002006 [Phytophthora kernoviae]